MQTSKKDFLLFMEILSIKHFNRSANPLKRWTGNMPHRLYNICMAVVFFSSRKRKLNRITYFVFKTDNIKLHEFLIQNSAFWFSILHSNYMIKFQNIIITMSVQRLQHIHLVHYLYRHNNKIPIHVSYTVKRQGKHMP